MKWFRKKSDEGTATIIVTASDEKTNKKAIMPPMAMEDAAQTIVRERNMSNWLDQAVRECEEAGGLENLEGRGKPIVVKGGDPLNSILKNANVLPGWLELQHEIRDQIQKLIERMDYGQTDISGEIQAINKQIIRYNQSVPTPILQKGRLAADSIREQVDRWQ